MCMCAYVHVCICACMHVCMCVCVHICMCVRVYVHVCMCVCVYVCTCVCMYVHVCMCVCTCVNVMYVCMWCDVCICVWVHVCMQLVQWGSPFTKCSKQNRKDVREGGRGPSGVNVYHKTSKLPDMYMVVGIQYMVAKQHVFPGKTILWLNLLAWLHNQSLSKDLPSFLSHGDSLHGDSLAHAVHMHYMLPGTTWANCQADYTSHILTSSGVVRSLVLARHLAAVH